MKKFIKWLFTMQMPGYIPDPEAKKSTVRMTYATLYFIVCHRAYLILKDKARDDMQGEFSLTDTWNYYTKDMWDFQRGLPDNVTPLTRAEDDTDKVNQWLDSIYQEPNQ